MFDLAIEYQREDLEIKKELRGHKNKILRKIKKEIKKRNSIARLWRV